MSLDSWLLFTIGPKRQPWVAQPGKPSFVIISQDVTGMAGWPGPTLSIAAFSWDTQ